MDKIKLVPYGVLYNFAAMCGLYVRKTLRNRTVFLYSLQSAKSKVQSQFKVWCARSKSQYICADNVFCI